MNTSNNNIIIIKQYLTTFSEQSGVVFSELARWLMQLVKLCEQSVKIGPCEQTYYIQLEHDFRGGVGDVKSGHSPVSMESAEFI